MYIDSLMIIAHHHSHAQMAHAPILWGMSKTVLWAVFQCENTPANFYSYTVRDRISGAYRDSISLPAAFNVNAFVPCAILARFHAIHPKHCAQCVLTFRGMRGYSPAITSNTYIV